MEKSHLKVKSTIQKNFNQNPVTVDVIKYARFIFFKNEWDKYPDAVNYRGAVEINGEQVVDPMKKCFNYKENKAGAELGDDTPVKYFKKYTGFMINLTFNREHGWIISTTGTAHIYGCGNETDNKFIAMGLEYLKKFNGFAYYIMMAGSVGVNICHDIFTVTFEVCHPDDPHIVDEIHSLYPLCYQLRGKTYPLHSAVAPETGETTLGELKKMLSECKHEGYMVYSMDGNLLFKMKSPYYLAKKWLQRAGASKVFSDLYKERLDEEYYPIVEFIRAHFTKDNWEALNEQSKSDVFLAAYQDYYGGNN